MCCAKTISRPGKVSYLKSLLTWRPMLNCCSLTKERSSIPHRPIAVVSVVLFLFFAIVKAMHVSMLSPKGGGGNPGQMWSISLFRRIFGQNSHYGAPKFGQIRSNIPRCSINWYWKWIVRSSVLYKYKNKFLPLLKAAVFQGFTKAPKAGLLQFQDGRPSTCPFL